MEAPQYSEKEHNDHACHEGQTAEEAHQNKARQSQAGQDEWWRSAVIYQVYPRSFQDSDGDGIGNLAGVTARLPYLKQLGVDAVWMSPHYPSPQADTGYDVADYFDVNPDYGTLDDFDALVSRVHQLGMKIIIDIVPNHSSSEMVWFQEALRAEPNSPQRDRYIFRYSLDGAPNNWGSMFGGRAWTRVAELTGREADRGWWYLHLFAPEQPDFNWDNSDVHEFFKSYFRFWCDRGVDGFRVDVAHGLVKQEGLPDDAIGPDRWAQADGENQNTGPFWDQPGVHDIYREWRAVLDEYGRDRMLVAEAWLVPQREALYVRNDEMSQAFNFDYLKAGWNPQALRTAIDTSLEAMGAVGAPVTWVMSNHDVVRATTRFGYEPPINTDRGIGVDDPQPDRELGLQRARAMAIVTMGLPGSMYIWEGEELGLPEVTDLPDEARQDPTWLRTGHTVRGRDGCRVPLPWEADKENCGFSTGTPWLPQPAYWAEYAADVQIHDPNSTWNLYRSALARRRELQLAHGSVVWLTPEGDSLLAFRNGGVVLALNMGSEERVISGVSSVVISSHEIAIDSAGAHVPPNCGAWLVAS